MNNSDLRWCCCKDSDEFGVAVIDGDLLSAGAVVIAVIGADASLSQYQ